MNHLRSLCFDALEERKLLSRGHLVAQAKHAVAATTLVLNGTLTVDYTEADEKIERAGIIGLQIHGGAKAKVFYKNITIEELPAKK